MRIWEKTYHLLILPAILLLIAYFLVVRNITEGKITEALLAPWGTAIVLMLVSQIYLEAIFTSPRYALVNALNAVVVGIVLFKEQKDILNFWIIITYCLLVFLASLLFFLFYEKQKKVNFFTEFSASLGSAIVIFPIIAIIQFTKFEILDSTLKVDFEGRPLLLLFAYYLIFRLLTAKGIIEWVKNLPSKLFGIFSSEQIGTIRANQSPNIVIVYFKRNSGIKINDLVLFGKELREKDGTLKKQNSDKVALVLDFIGMENELDSVSARLYLLNEPQRELNEERSGLIKIKSECSIIRNPEEFIQDLDCKKITYYWERRNDIVGLVSFDTSINILRSDILRHKQLENAELVSIINDNIENPIRYQIIEAETQRESVEEKKDYGYTKYVAYQLGEWRKPKDAKGEQIKNKFHQFFEFPWTPQINSLTFKWNKTIDEKNLNEEGVDTKGYFLLGNIPKTGLPIYLNIKDLVSHHTAVLGVTGSGKSTLVFKLLDEIVKIKTLVICIDITGEYKNKVKNFEYFFNDNTRKLWATEIKTLNDGRRKKSLSFNDKDRITPEDLDKIEAGCVNTMNKIVKDRIVELREINKKVVFELLEISNTKISIDCTQYIIQGLLEYAKEIYDSNLSLAADKRDDFQSCIVLEEAHTLVPENIGVGGRYSEAAVVIDKISQIALQGRKYNVGFILISQRTATVKKTVLNQCNTMISFRAYDETSFNFLSSYFGDEYVKEISHLKNDGDSRYIIASGKAVVADRPVIVEIKEK